MAHLFKLISLLFLAAVCNAYTLRGAVSLNSIVQLEQDDFQTTVLKLTPTGSTDSKTTYLRKDGTFRFEGLGTGIYALELRSVSLLARSIYRVDITEDDGITMHHVFPGHDFDTDLGPVVDHPVVVDVVRPTYVNPRPEFSLIQMLSSPMMLLSLGSLVMVFVTPKLTAGLDPEALADLQQSQKQSQAAMDKVQNFDMAAYMAGRSTSAQPKKAQAVKRR